MKELMIHVERIVRPIRADWSKLRMRRELLGHLRAAFEEERARGVEDAAALAEAKRRLGEPATLRKELEDSVSRLERLAVTPFPGSAGFIFLAMGVLLPVVLAIAYFPASVTSWQSRVIFVAGIVVMECSAVSWYAFTIGFFRIPVRWPRVVGAGIAAIVSGLAWIFLVNFALTGRAAPHDLAQAACVQLLMPALGIAATLAKRPIKQWLELDIAG